MITQHNPADQSYEPSEDEALKKFLSKKESNGSVVFKDYSPTIELVKKHKKRYMDAFGIEEELTVSNV